MNYDVKRSERKETKEKLNRKAKKNFRKDSYKKRDASKIIERKRIQYQKLESDSELLE